MAKPIKVRYSDDKLQLQHDLDNEYTCFQRLKQTMVDIGIATDAMKPKIVADLIEALIVSDMELVQAVREKMKESFIAEMVAKAMNKTTTVLVPRGLGKTSPGGVSLGGMQPIARNSIIQAQNGGTSQMQSYKTRFVKTTPELSMDYQPPAELPGDFLVTRQKFLEHFILPDTNAPTEGHEDDTCTDDTGCQSNT